MYSAPLHLDAVRQTAKAITAANLDVYEAATRAVTALETLLAGSAVYEPIGSLAQACAEMTRDATAVHLSTARWILDL
jgi:hypothetical protein